MACWLSGRFRDEPKGLLARVTAREVVTGGDVVISFSDNLLVSTKCRQYMGRSWAERAKGD